MVDRISDTSILSTTGRSKDKRRGLGSANHTLFLLLTPQLANIHQRRQFHVATQDILADPVERLAQSTSYLPARGDAKDSVQFFQGKLLGLGEDDKSCRLLERTERTISRNDYLLRNHSMPHQAAYQPKAPCGWNASTSAGQVNERMKLKAQRTAVAEAMPTSRTCECQYRLMN